MQDHNAHHQHHHTCTFMTNLFHLCLKLGRGEEEFYIFMWSLGRHFTMDSWLDTCGPSIDPDSPLPYHRGGYSIPPFQTHSRYFYAPLGEACCGRHFTINSTTPSLIAQSVYVWCLVRPLTYVGNVALIFNVMAWAWCNRSWGSHLNDTLSWRCVFENEGLTSAGYQRKNGLRYGEKKTSLFYDLPFYRISFPTPVLAHFGAMC